MDAGQVALLAFAVLLSILPRFGHLRLEHIAVLFVEQVPLVAVGVCGTVMASVTVRHLQQDGVCAVAVRWTWSSGGLWVVATRDLADVAQPLEAVGRFPFALVISWKRA